MLETVSKSTKEANDAFTLIVVKEFGIITHQITSLQCLN